MGKFTTLKKEEWIAHLHLLSQSHSHPRTLLFSSKYDVGRRCCATAMLCTSVLRSLLISPPTSYLQRHPPICLGTWDMGHWTQSATVSTDPFPFLTFPILPATPCAFLMPLADVRRKRGQRFRLRVMKKG